MKKYAAGVLFLLLIAAAPAALACKVCDGNGCKNAGPTEPGRSNCTATTSSCTISGSTCYSGGGCDCGDYGCGFCENSCLENPFGSVQWQLVAVEVIPASAQPRPDWVLVRVDVTSPDSQAR